MNPAVTLNNRHPIAAPSASANQAYFFIRWSFYLFAFFIPLENVNLFGITVFFSITKMAGVLFAGLVCLQPGLCLARPPKAFWCFVAYGLVNVFAALVVSKHETAPFISPLFTLAQNIVMFWMSFNLMRNDKCAKWALMWFSAGTIVVSLAIWGGIGETVTATQAGERVSGLGADLNVFAYIGSFGALVLLGLALGRAEVKTTWALLPYPLALLLIVRVIGTGSRGGMLCLGIGLLVLLFRGGRFNTRLKAMAIIAMVLVAGAREFLRSDVALERWRSTLETGELAGRENILGESCRMVMEKPLFGWGPVTHLHELGDRTNVGEEAAWESRDTHNDLLWAMTATGLLGTIPLVLGVGLCIWSAWRGRKASQGYLPLVLALAVLTMSMSLTIHIRKVTWLMLAYAAVSSTYVLPHTPRVVNPRRDNRPREFRLR